MEKRSCVNCIYSKLEIETYFNDLMMIPETVPELHCKYPESTNDGTYTEMFDYFEEEQEIALDCTLYQCLSDSSDADKSIHRDR